MTWRIGEGQRRREPHSRLRQPTSTTACCKAGVVTTAAQLGLLRYGQRRWGQRRRGQTAMGSSSLDPPFRPRYPNLPRIRVVNGLARILMPSDPRMCFDKGELTLNRRATLGYAGPVYKALILALVVIVSVLSLSLTIGRRRSTPRLRNALIKRRSFDADAYVLVALALLAAAAFIGTESRVGRLVLHAFPLYLPVLAVGVDKSLCVRRDYT